MLVEIKTINKKEVPVVTSLDVAKTFCKEHEKVLQDIQELKCSGKFRQHNFVGDFYVDGKNRKKNMYYITRDGFTLLVMGYNSKKTIQFKEAYINQFNTAEKSLIGKIKEREKGIAVRQALTRSIQQSNENKRMNGHAYSTYTNCIYDTLFGKNANQMRKELGIDKQENIRDHLSEGELKQIQSMECLVSGLVDCGWDYNKVKTFIKENNAKNLLP